MLKATAPKATTPTTIESSSETTALAPDLEVLVEVLEEVVEEPVLVLVLLLALVLRIPPLALPLNGTSELLVLAALAAYAASVFAVVGSLTTMTIPDWQWVNSFCEQKIQIGSVLLTVTEKVVGLWLEVGMKPEKNEALRAPTEHGVAKEP